MIVILFDQGDVGSRLGGTRDVDPTWSRPCLLVVMLSETDYMLNPEIALCFRKMHVTFFQLVHIEMYIMCIIFFYNIGAVPYFYQHIGLRC